MGEADFKMMSNDIIFAIISPVCLWHDKAKCVTPVFLGEHLEDLEI